MAYAEPQNLSTIAAMFTYANEVTGNLAGVVLLLATFVTVAWYFLYTEKPQVAFVTAATITMFVNIIFMLNGFITENAFFVFCTVFVISLIILFVNIKDN